MFLLLTLNKYILAGKHGFTLAPVTDDFLSKSKKFLNKKYRVLLKREPTSTQLHPPPPSPTHLHPAHFGLHPALCNTLNVNRTKKSHVMGNFLKFSPKNLKLSILTENWHSRYLGGADFESSPPQKENPFLGKFGPKESKLSVLPENWHTWYLEDVDSYFNVSCLNFPPKIEFWANFGPKKSKLSVLSENWHTWYLEDADSYSDICFLNFKS